ncbi:MAG TPA: TldD/PmbA family protein [Candidatus Xenobia bacterium]
MTLEERFRRIAPAVDFCSLRMVDELDESLTVRRGVLQPFDRGRDIGAMVTVIHQGSLGYAATSDITEAGLRQAADQALDWSRRVADRGVVDYRTVPLPHPQGEYETPVRVPWESMSLSDKIAMLQEANRRMAGDDRIIDCEASLWRTRVETTYLTSGGGHLVQRLHYLVPGLSATAHLQGETQTRSLHGRDVCRQGGLELLEEVPLVDEAPRVAREAIELLLAPDCPEGSMDVLLDPGQMILQIHESIGHPLELDRILGDERNYAGTSFVTLDMFGKYRYGSDLLNITYDPTRPDQYASYGWDDEGLAARREHVIFEGLLLRPLGGVISQARAGMAGVANARACSWNRPPIDRMANLNLEPGASTLDDMVASIERGVYMKSNTSWSIDDSRNKFQFGCEWGQLIKGGKLGPVVRNPNYRGVSATFWRSLRMVGRAETMAYLGTPFCGKGEPNQSIRVGHASPACVFSGVEVFGGA